MSICQPVLIFCTTKTLDVVVELRDEYFSPTVISYDSETSIDVKNFDDAFDVDCNDRDFNLATLDPKQDVALILTSSGTTGLPKCVQLTHANLRNTMIYAGEASFMDINKRESVLAFLPFFHILGLGTTLASVLYGAKTVILDRFVPERFLGLIEKHKITKLFVVPSVLIFFVKSPLVEKYDVSSIGDVLCASDSLKRELEEMVEKRLKIKSVRQIYGLTEVSGAVTVTPKSVKRFGSCGQVQNGFQVKVCDPDTGTALISGQVGELRVRGDGIMKGYLGCEEETQKVFDREGFLKTGDLGYYDIAGFFYVVDRLKEIIKYKGFQVRQI
jgi:4-coumarate--CoA ligase